MERLGGGQVEGRDGGKTVPLISFFRNLSDFYRFVCGYHALVADWLKRGSNMFYGEFYNKF